MTKSFTFYVEEKLSSSLADLEGRGGVLRGLNTPFQISKIKESNKTKQKIEDNTLEKEE